MKDNQPNLNLSRGFRTSYPDIMDNGLAADILLNEFFGSAPPPSGVVWGKIKVAGTFVDILDRKFKVGGTFVSAVGYKVKVAGMFVDVR